MCSYQLYISKNIICNINLNISEKYTEYIYYNYICKLASNINKFNYIFYKQKKLQNQFFISETKNIYFRKLLRANKKKLRKFDSCKNKNIKILKKLE